jgi:hypothetical protein
VTLQPGTTYHYRVLAAKRVQSEDGVNWQGPFAEGPDQTFTTLPPSTPPSEVVTGPAEPTPGGYKLKGKLNPDGLPTTYYYEYIGSNEVECLDMELGMARCWHETAHVGPITGDTQQEIPPVEVTGLTVGVTYRYRLVAHNADRAVFGNEASFAVTAKGAPSGQAKQEPKSKPPAPLVTQLAVTSPPIKTTTKYKPLTKAQKLTNALKACKSKPKKQRGTCKKQAREKYGKRAAK